MFLPGITISVSFSIVLVNLTFFLAKRYESVATVSNKSLVNLKFTPVNIGLSSWLDIANTV